MILTRNDNRKLLLNRLELEMFLGDMFELCESEKETDWLEQEIMCALENVAQEKRDGRL